MRFFKHDPDRETVREATQSDVHWHLGFVLTAMLIESGCLRTGGIVWEARK